MVPVKFLFPSILSKYLTHPSLVFTFFSSFLPEQYSCRTAPDENGVMRRKCERIVRKFRMCPGR